MFDIYSYVYRHLQATEKSVNRIAAESKVPITTIQDIKTAKTDNPRINTLKKLASYFESFGA